METHIKVKSPKLMALVLMLGAFVGLFGETALNMALTNVMEQFSITAATAQWLTTGYLLTLAILVPVSALLVKWFTTRQLVVGGLLLSLIGAGLAALSPSFTILLLGRIVQAIGTGIILPVMINVILLIFPIQKRGAVMGIVGLVITAGPALGPTLSGLVISTLGWNYIFWFSAVLYVVLIVIGAPVMTNVSEITKPKMDVLSILLSTIGFGGIIYALATMAEISISAPQVWVPLVIGIIAILLFGVRQVTMVQPMVNIRVFKYRMFSLGTLSMFLSILVILSTSILLPIYLKGALSYSALVAGLLLLPGNAINFAMSPFVGAMFDKIGPRKFLMIGYICVVIANIMFLTIISATTPVWQIIVAFMILFLGLTMTTMPAQTNAMNELPRELYADGNAAMNTLNQVAGAAGTAIAITLFTAGQVSFAASTPNAAAPEVLAAGVKHVFYFITGISVVGLISSLFIRKAHAEQLQAPVASKITQSVH